MDLNLFSAILGITAGSAQLFGYWIYIRRAKGLVNTGSWSIWALSGFLDLISYFIMTEGDWVVNILPAACAAAAVSVFTWACLKKRFTWPDRTDWVLVGGDSVISVVWFFTNAVVANLLFQISTVISFIPIWRGQLAGREEEDPTAWLIWAGSYFLLTIAVIIRMDQWEELAFPVSHVATHLVVALIAIRKLRPAR